MTFCPPERSPRYQSTGFPEGRARKRKRTPSDERRAERRRAELPERIDTTAHERHKAWLESGRPNDTYRLTQELDGLYDEHRDEQAGTLTDPYYGRIWTAR